jgi:hypothetical protein
MMHPNAALLEKLYKSVNTRDLQGMASCYHPQATFEDIAFHLKKPNEIRAMWDMITVRSGLTASFEVLHADGGTGIVDVIDVYTYRDKPQEEPGHRVRNVIRSKFAFRDGLIIAQRDSCNALWWGVQALGPVKGLLSWLVPAKRRKMAKAKLDAFIASHPAYA